MSEEPNNNKFDLILIKESVWKVEDRLNVVMECQADQEAELIRLKRLVDLASERLGRIEANRSCNLGGIKNE